MSYYGYTATQIIFIFPLIYFFYKDLKVFIFFL